MSDYIEYNGEKIKPRVFDYDTPEGWNEFVRFTAGSISDKSFVRPGGYYEENICDMDAWAKKVDAMYGSITDETFIVPDDWEKNEKVLS